MVAATKMRVSAATAQATSATLKLADELFAVREKRPAMPVRRLAGRPASTAERHQVTDSTRDGVGSSPLKANASPGPLLGVISSQSTIGSEGSLGSAADSLKSYESPCWLELAYFDVWDAYRYQPLKTTRLGDGAHAQLELHLDRMTGATVCVKRFSRSRLGENPLAFHQRHPRDLENPWQELRFAHELGPQGPYGHLGICPYRGIFRDGSSGDALIATDWMAQGDLFSFISSLGPPGPEREAQVVPVLNAIMEKVSALHFIGLAHCDLSVENVLLHPPANDGTISDVALIDFAMALSGEEARAAHGVRGKPIYRAPEVYSGKAYDACAADLFACGVMAYTLAIGRYPWESTVPGECKAFDFFMAQGFHEFLRKRRVPEKGGVRAAECISKGFTAIIGMLLSPDPRRRFLALSALGC